MAKSAKDPVITPKEGEEVFVVGIVFVVVVVVVVFFIVVSSSLDSASSFVSIVPVVVVAEINGLCKWAAVSNHDVFT